MCDIIEALNSAGVRASYQRVMILKAIRSTKKHPTADELLEIVKDMSDISISRATLYNTLLLFTEKGLITQLDTARNESRYDATTFFHPHFICEKCSKIIDLDGEIPNIEVPEGFSINRLTLNINGLCRECSENIKK